MKKKFAVLGLATAMMLSMFTGCSDSNGGDTATDAGNKTADADDSGSKSSGSGEGSVYYLNFKPEAETTLTRIFAAASSWGSTC